MPQKRYPHKKRFLRMPLVLGTVAVLVLFGAYFLPVRAASDSKLQDELEKIEKKIQTNNQLLNLKQQQRSALEAQIRSLEAQAIKLENEINKSERQIDNLDQEIADITLQISEKEKLIAIQKNLLGELMRSYYDRQGQSQFQLLLSVNEASQLMSNNDWTLQTGDRIREILGEIRVIRQSLGERHETLQSKKNELDSLRLQLEQRNIYLENTKQSKEVAVTQTKKEENKYQSIISDLEKERKEIEEEIEKLEADKVGQLDLSKIPAFKKSLLAYPVGSVRISQKYGKTTFTRWYSFHNGIDFAGPSGTSIYAAADGKVLATGNNGKYAYGKWIAIDHGNGLVTLYGHLSSQKVSKGDKVEKGERIGLMGSTGYSTGPHLHFTVFAKNSFEVVPSSSVKGLMLPMGAHVNPSKYLP
jgi:murein DD-endopeptidase MepM/ murein hydrolase activator NlpD